MITHENLNDVSAQFSMVENLVAALDLGVDALEEVATTRYRRNLDALIGVNAALNAQLKKAHNDLEGLFRLAQGLEVSAWSPSSQKPLQSAWISSASTLRLSLANCVTFVERLTASP